MHGSNVSIGDFEPVNTVWVDFSQENPFNKKSGFSRNMKTVGIYLHSFYSEFCIYFSLNLYLFIFSNPVADNSNHIRNIAGGSDS